MEARLSRKWPGPVLWGPYCPAAAEGPGAAAMAEAALLLLPEAAAESDARERLALWDRRPDTTAPLTDRQTDSVLELKAAAENLPVPAEVRCRAGTGLRGSSGARVALGFADPCPGSLFAPPRSRWRLGWARPLTAQAVGPHTLPSRAGTAPNPPLRHGAVGQEPCPGLTAPASLMSARHHSAAHHPAGGGGTELEMLCFTSASCWYSFTTFVKSAASFSHGDRPKLGPERQCLRAQ